MCAWSCTCDVFCMCDAELSVLVVAAVAVVASVGGYCNFTSRSPRWSVELCVLIAGMVDSQVVKGGLIHGEDGSVTRIGSKAATGLGVYLRSVVIWPSVWIGHCASLIKDKRQPSILGEVLK